MHYAALVRPAIDRVYISMRMAGRPHTHEVVQRHGLQPGFVASFHFGLLARPMSAAGFAAATTYSGSDMTEELSQGIAFTDDAGAWQLTDSGRALGLDFQQAVAAGAQEHWAGQPVARLAELLDILLASGAASGGPAFTAMAPVFEPPDSSDALKVAARLGALRHHRGDAHRAAWAAAGVSLAELKELPMDSPQRRAIEEETNRLDAPIYEALSEVERWEFLAILARLP